MSSPDFPSAAAIAPSVRTLVELHQEAAIAVAPDGRLVAANARAIAELDLHASDIRFADLLADPGEASGFLARLLRSPASVTFELGFRWGDGMKRIGGRGGAIGLDGGTCLLVLSDEPLETGRDQASLRAKAEELARVNLQLVEAKQRAEEANHSKTEFLARVSHELRTPLNAIIGFSEIMAGGIFGPIAPQRYNAYINDILTSGRHLLDLVNDVLDLSRVEAGKLTLRDQVIDLSTLGGHVLRLIEKAAAEKQLTLEMTTQSDLPPLFADPRTVRQMLLNLLSNAVKFTLPGGRVRLSVSLGSDERDGIVLAVEDTGIGIAEKNIARCLQPFDQIDNIMTRRFDGSGLGLAITRALIELHGGRIEIESAIGVGTVVRLVFPKTRSRGFLPADPEET